MWEEFECSDPENFVPDCFDDVHCENDIFAGFEKRIEKFKKDLKILKEGAKESCYFPVLYGAFFKLDEIKDTFVEDREVLESVLGTEFLSCLEKKREGLYLDLNLNTFERQCQEKNYLLIEKKLFLRVYELNKKFRYLIKKGPQKKQSSKSDKVYKPVSNIHQTIDCYIAKSIRQTYRGIVSKSKIGVHSTTADQCYDCNKLFTQKNNLEKHLKICGSMPGLVDKFKNQNISTFEDNVKFNGDLPFSIYFDLETTCGIKPMNLRKRQKCI